MSFYEVVHQRRSIRNFSDAPVPEDKLHRILEAARLGPSAGNLQSFQIVVVRDKRVLSQLAEACHEQSQVAKAGLALVFCAVPRRCVERYRERGVQLYATQDTAIACSLATLAATAEGLGSCWVGAFNDEAVGRVIKAPPDVRPQAVLPIGVVASQPRHARELLPANDMIVLEHF
ncbi:putative FMN reductase [Paratrimastix pyriformis]|uniref:FMN reductase n=1 Tax=Paratrimastix pyriformis TaxID=342808 RepID=A0ABQ8U7K4_9EUKA|nr:putative FMN reductase [Paratrimastix pyriformis]